MGLAESKQVNMGTIRSRERERHTMKLESRLFKEMQMSEAIFEGLLFTSFWPYKWPSLSLVYCSEATKNYAMEGRNSFLCGRSIEI